MQIFVRLSPLPHFLQKIILKNTFLLDYRYQDPDTIETVTQLVLRSRRQTLFAAAGANHLDDSRSILEFKKSTMRCMK